MRRLREMRVVANVPEIGITDQFVLVQILPRNKRYLQGEVVGFRRPLRLYDGPQRSVVAGESAGAEWLARSLEHTFCRVLLVDDPRDHLATKAAYSFPRESALAWHPHLNESARVDDSPTVGQVIASGEPQLLSAADPAAGDALRQLSAYLGLSSPLRSLLTVPLKNGVEIIGLLEIGEVRDSARSRFTADTIELVQMIGGESSVLIERLRRQVRCSSTAPASGRER
jgi:GAF domain-containing protein